MKNAAPKLLVIGLMWPEPRATAAGVRMCQLLSLFVENGFLVTLASAASLPEHNTDWQALGIETVAIQLNSSTFDDFLGNLQPNIVLFDRFLTEEQYGWRVNEHCPKAIRILDTEDLHSLRTARQEAHKKNMPFTTSMWMGDDKTLREVASILRCDLSLIISSFEMKLLQEGPKISHDLLMHLPLFVEEQNVMHAYPNFEERHDFIFIGGGKHAPNVDAIIYLKKSLWPKIKKQIPKAVLFIYGAYLPQHILDFHDPKEGFLVKGWIDNVSEVLPFARVCLAPLRFGAGIKGKLLDAMKYGTPSVTTPTGAEGMHGNLPWNGQVAQSEAEFVTGAVALYLNKGLWQKSQENGYKLLRERYDKNQWGCALLQRIETIRENITEHRYSNFMGRLLQHHTLQSTKYMSKWIALKNKGS
jgi:hypothetical protein